MTSFSHARTARTTGLIYLVVVLTGIVSLAYVPSQVVVPGDGAATVARLTAAEGLFRLGIAAGVLCYLAFLLLPLAFHRLLAHVDQRAATLMVLFAVVSVPISLYNLTHKLDVLALLGATAGLSADALQAEVMRSLARYSSGVLIAKIFWGLWLFPLGLLVYRSRMLPRALGVFLMLGCIGYLVDVTGRILVPGYAETPLADWATRPAAIGEIGTCLWLLAFGVRGGGAPSVAGA